MRKKLRPISEEVVAAQLIQAVLHDVEIELTKRGSDLTGSEGLDSLFAWNAADILNEVLTLSSWDEPTPEHGVSVEYRAESGRTGVDRAVQHLHPAESLMAAEVLFNTAIEHLVPLMNVDGSADGAIKLAQALHHAIWRRFPPGAIAYVEHILGQLESTNREERKRVAREIHDRISHGIAAGLQRIELSRLKVRIESTDLDRAQEILASALSDAQDIAVSLRRIVGDRTLDVAIRQHLEETNLGPLAVVRTLGKPRPLTQTVNEELFTIAVEAIRNVKQHAVNFDKIEVIVYWSRRDVRLTVSDNGKGFDISAVPPGSIGIFSMEERARMIGGTFSLATDHQGTQVVITVPTLEMLLQSD